MSTLFDTVSFNGLTLPNRLAMAPLTRNRANPTRAVTPLVRDYYEQRATAGLIISEATQISPMGQGYLDTPGIYSAEQVSAWKVVTDAVHAKGGHMVCQLWHVGRISHSSLLPDGQAPVSSTAKAAIAKTYTAEGFTDVSTPRALRTDELASVIADYRQAALNAIAAGFDGVEIHSANGYLLEQFLRDSINDRTDSYGGSIENRIRLVIEVVDAVINAIGASRTGIRLSPVTAVNDAHQDSDAQLLFGTLVDALSQRHVAFIHVIEGTTGGARDNVAFDYEALRVAYKAQNPTGLWIVNNGYTGELAKEVVAQGHADMVAFGRPFISNPDLVARLKNNSPLNALDASTLYGGGAKGYTDYPAL